MAKLTVKDELEIRKFAIISIIRLFSEFNFGTTEVAIMMVTGKTVRSIIEDNMSIGDEALFMLYDKNIDELGEAE